MLFDSLHFEPSPARTTMPPMCRRGHSGQVTTTNGGLPVGVTNCTLTWPEFTGPDAKTCRVGED
jgi:hypothetical protein